MCFLAAPEVTVVGEAMVERRADGASGFGGDALNVAVYLSRLGVRARLASAVGTCVASADLLAALEAEGVDTPSVLIEPFGELGAYAIALDAMGERAFSYDRSRSPFTRWQASDALGSGSKDTLFLSGITLAVLPPAARQRLLERVREHRQAGGQAAFDTNYRPTLWRSAEKANAMLREALAAADVALVGADDARALGLDPHALIDAAMSEGCEVACLKDGARTVRF